MAVFNWKPEYSVGVAEIDKQHMVLIDMINELYDAMSQGKGQDVLKSILSKLTNYTITHFGWEEKNMSNYNYPESFDHKDAHKVFIAKVTDLNTKFTAGSTFITIEVGNFLKDWLLNHILKTDKKFGAFLNQNGLK